MSLLQTKINQELPYGRVFQGSGEQDPYDRDVMFYQLGLYFKANGELAAKSPHNAAKIALIESLGVNPDAPAPVMQKPDRAPVNPEIVAKLSELTDEEIQAVAERLVAALTERGDVVEYVPSEHERDDNISFIAAEAG
jgi:hypothetical protein